MVKDEGINKYIGDMEDELNRTFYLDAVRLNKDKTLNKLQWYEILDHNIKARWFIFCNRN